MSTRIALAIRHADGTAQEHTVACGTYTMGRGDDCDIVLASADVSQQHARIALQQTDCLIEDLHSTHGTLVNGEQLNAPISCPYPARLQLASVIVEIKAATAGSPGRWKPPSKEDMTRLLPEYRIEKLIGRGGMGAVYKATQITLDRPVAIKILPAELSRDTEFTSRFEREARTLGQLEHPGIVQVYRFGQTTREGHLYFVMEFVDGTDLRHLIKAGDLKPDRALELVGQICDALLVAHRQGVIHRDIKPENILITNEGRVKLVDFGLARPVHEDVSRLTNPNVAMGTPDYMSPEQFLGLGDQRTDIFALGVVLYEMLTGKPPSGAFDVPSSKVQMDVRIDEVVFKALQQEPERRYQHVSEMKSALDHIRTTQPLRKVPAQEPPKTLSNPGTGNKSLGRRMLSAGFGAVVLAAVCLLGFGKKTQPDEKSQPSSTQTGANVAAPTVVQKTAAGTLPPVTPASVKSEDAASVPKTSGWDIVRLGGRDYVDAGSLGGFYRFSSVKKEQSSVWLRSPTIILKGQVGSQELLINNIKFILNNKVVEADGKVLFSRLDLVKVIDPVLRPSYISTASNFDTVVIDPSWGGHESGAQGAYGYEKDFTLKMAMSLRTTLMQRGFKVILTRSNDSFLTLGDRVATANRTPKSIYLGLQFNSGEPDDSGLETYALSPQGPVNESGLTGNQRDSENIALATAIHAMAVSKFKIADRGIKSAPRKELSGLKIPGVVFIGGFVTNEQECRLIASDTHRQKVSDALGDAIVNYRKALAQNRSSPKAPTKPEPAKTTEPADKPAPAPKAVESAAVPALAKSGPTSPPAQTEPPAKVPVSVQPRLGYSRYPWKQDIVTTVFWVGEPSGNNTTSRNSSSSWDPSWEKNFGGTDDPDPTKRTNDFRPAAFVPKLNPFYVALPYNDVLNDTAHKPEAANIIPWFKQRFTQAGKTVLSDQWVAIRFGNRVCYAQWEDCGPALTDDHEYVFGSTRPRNTSNGGAGLEISPAVRDYLGMSGSGKCDWRFVDLNEIPAGPWRTLGDNNHFARNQKTENAREHDAVSARLEELRRLRDDYLKKNGGITETRSSKTMSADNETSAKDAAEKQPTAPTAAAYPTAKPVPDKPGFVFSPHVASGGMVDVRDMKSGMKIKCPYTQKVFLVP